MAKIERASREHSPERSVAGAREHALECSAKLAHPITMVALLPCSAGVAVAVVVAACLVEEAADPSHLPCRHAADLAKMGVGRRSRQFATCLLERYHSNRQEPCQRRNRDCRCARVVDSVTNSKV